MALKLISGIGNHRIAGLLEAFGAATSVFAATSQQLRQVEGIGRETAASITEFDDWKRVDALLERTRRIGARLVTLYDSDYPSILKQISDPPPLLWVLGSLKALSTRSVAVVGTRRPDRYGMDQAEEWSAILARNGFTVVSGLAHGVDTIAHRQTVQVNGRTIAVLGSGLDRLYPKDNRRLAREIVEKGGAVITELPPGSPAHSGNFPVRNRIVSGLSLGVLIIQSGIRGGSMITARLALDQNREVFVVPHQLNRARGSGNNHLIRSGEGKLVATLEDIVTELPPAKSDSGSLKSEGNQSGKRLSISERVASLPDESRRIVDLLQEGEQQIDHLASRCGYTMRELLPLLMQLELTGWIRQRSGRYFSLRRAAVSS